VDAMNLVNPNLAMTVSPSKQNDRHVNLTKVCCHQTDDIKPEVSTLYKNDIYKSGEPIMSSRTQTLPAVSQLLKPLTSVSSHSPTALVVTCSTKQKACQQQTIIVTRSCYPMSYNTSPVVARVSKAAGVLSTRKTIRPTSVTINGSSALIFSNNAVLSQEENCLC